MTFPSVQAFSCPLLGRPYHATRGGAGQSWVEGDPHAGGASWRFSAVRLSPGQRKPGGGGQQLKIAALRGFTLAC